MVYDLSAPKIAIVLGNSSVEEQLCSLLSSAHVTILFDLTTPHWPSYLPRTLIAAAHTHALVLTTSIDDGPLVATVAVRASATGVPLDPLLGQTTCGRHRTRIRCVHEESVPAVFRSGHRPCRRPSQRVRNRPRKGTPYFSQVEIEIQTPK